MAAKKKRKTTIPAVQQHIQIQEIKDDIVVLKDGTLRSVILVSSINFALKSEEEQTAVIQAYTQMLNAFEFPLQIVIQSRKLNIELYLEKLNELGKQQTNELLKMQTIDYRQYISELVDIADIMSKRFYLVVPYSPFSSKPKGFFTRFREALSPTTIIRIKQKKFERYHTEVVKRTNYVIDNLSGMGLKAIQLDTQSLIELYYNTYNPLISSQQKLEDVQRLEVKESEIEGGV